MDDSNANLRTRKRKPILPASVALWARLSDVAADAVLLVWLEKGENRLVKFM
jgi:hypothetical protein